MRKITEKAGWVSKSIEEIKSEIAKKYGDTKIYNFIQKGGKLIFDYAVKTVKTVDKWLSNYQWYRTAKNVVSSTATKVVDYIKNLEIYKVALQGWQDGRATFDADKAKIKKLINDLLVKFNLVKSEEEKALLKKIEENNGVIDFDCTMLNGLLTKYLNCSENILTDVTFIFDKKNKFIDFELINFKALLNEINNSTEQSINLIPKLYEINNKVDENYDKVSIDVVLDYDLGNHIITSILQCTSVNECSLQTDVPIRLSDYIVISLIDDSGNIIQGQVQRNIHNGRYTITIPKYKLNAEKRYQLITTFRSVNRADVCIDLIGCQQNIITGILGDEVKFENKLLTFDLSAVYTKINQVERLYNVKFEEENGERYTNLGEIEYIEEALSKLPDGDIRKGLVINKTSNNGKCDYGTIFSEDNNLRIATGGFVYTYKKGVINICPIASYDGDNNLNNLSPITTKSIESSLSKLGLEQTSNYLLYVLLHENMHTQQSAILADHKYNEYKNIYSTMFDNMQIDCSNGYEIKNPLKNDSMISYYSCDNYNKDNFVEVQADDFAIFMTQPKYFMFREISYCESQDIQFSECKFDRYKFWMNYSEMKLSEDLKDIDTLSKDVYIIKMYADYLNGYDIDESIKNLFKYDTFNIDIIKDKLISTFSSDNGIPDYNTFIDSLYGN